MNMSELITSVIEKQEATYEVLVERAKKAGYPFFSGALISHWRNKKPTGSMKAETVHAFAAALEVTPEAVFLAVGESIGLSFKLYLPENANDPVVFVKHGDGETYTAEQLAEARQRINAVIDRELSATRQRLTDAIDGEGGPL